MPDFLLVMTWVLIFALRWKDKATQVHEREKINFYLAAQASIDAQQEVK